MGVSGCGKTTIGELLLHAWAAISPMPDSFHQSGEQGQECTSGFLDGRRSLPWLKAIRASIEEKAGRWHHARVRVFGAKAGYRDILLDGDTDVTFVYLKGTRVCCKSGSRHERPLSSIPNCCKASLILWSRGPDEAIERIFALTPETDWWIRC